jgi:hypothetical protein
MSSHNRDGVWLGRALRISYVTWTHDMCSYELEQLASSDTESDSYVYLVPLQWACLLVI